MQLLWPCPTSHLLAPLLSHQFCLNLVQVAKEMCHSELMRGPALFSCLLVVTNKVAGVTDGLTLLVEILCGSFTCYVFVFILEIGWLKADCLIGLPVREDQGEEGCMGNQLFF